MNFDLITKLAKLANNNPNEHEANLAARKVCKLLAEANFKFIKDETITVSEAQHKAASEPFPGFNFDFNEIIRNMYRSYPFDTEKKYKKGSWTESAEDRPKQAKDDNHYYSSPKWPGDSPFVKPSEQKEERMLKCKVCKQQKLTKFVGLAELFTCNNCQWTAYEHQKK